MMTFEHGVTFLKYAIHLGWYQRGEEREKELKDTQIIHFLFKKKHKCTHIVTLFVLQFLFIAHFL